MADCDYCGADVDDGGYADHLAAEHDPDELSPIDRRKAESAGGDDGDGLSRRTLLGGGAVAVGLGGVAGVALLRNGNSPQGFGPETEPLPEAGDEDRLADVETVAVESRQHVGSDTDVDFAGSPPAGGPHYDGTVTAGFYESSVSLGELVHTLEHGAVVDYYDPSAPTDRVRDSLRLWASEHTDPWASFVAVPTPVDDPDHPHVLAAWGRLLRLAEYDAEAVRAFCAEFIGRGPENPVR